MSLLTIDVARERDLPAIMVLEAAGFDHAHWSQEAWLAEIDGLDRHVVVIRSEAEDVLGVATFQLGGDVADLHRVIVDPRIRGVGLGHRLVLDGLAWAKREGAERMLLEVEHDNTPALTLYTTLGFTEISRRRDYYGAGRDALVMERKLS